MKMGEQLVRDMTGKWIAADFADSFKQQILQLVERKIKSGQTESVTPIEAVEPAEAGARIYDLSEMLRRSLDKLGKPAKPVAARAGASKAARAADSQPVARRGKSAKG